MMRRRRSPGLRILPKAALKWVDGSGAVDLLARQHALYLNLGLGPEPPLIYREQQIQKAVVQYIDNAYPQIGSLCFHVPLELLRRENHTAGMFHALGARAGVADLVMLVPRGAYHGLVIELKVPPRRPTDSQCNFLELARAQGYAACWSDSLNTVLRLIDVYLRLPPRAELAELTPKPMELEHEQRRRPKARRKAD
jgi:hypothetical protein